MRPSRLSSEAPEVVPHHLQEDQIFSPRNDSLNYKSPGEERESQYKQVDERETETTQYPPAATASPSPLLVVGGDRNSPYHTIIRRAPTRHQHSRTVLTTCVLMFVAFLVGGGIGGGVGGGLVLQAKSRVPVQATVTATATSTVTSPGCSPTVYADMAGCPGINHIAQSSPGSDVSYMVLCGSQILAPAGQNIEAFNSVQTSFGDCLNACATYKNKECVAVTWYQFWPANPAWNSVCFLKNGTGINTTLPDSQKLGYATSAILSSLVIT